MRGAFWSLLPVALVAGLAAGFLVRGQQVKTVTTTVVQIQTVAPPPPATNHMTAYIEADSNGSCLSSDSKYTNIAEDTWTLRGESNGLNSGQVLGTADSAEMDAQNCYLDVHYSLSPDLGFFYVHDDTNDYTWGPFDSHKLKSNGYRLKLYFR